MATYHAIAATSQAILRILAAACPRSEFPKADFKLYQSSDFDNPMKEGISLFLYHVTEDSAARNLTPRVAPDGSNQRPPLSLKLHYLLTAWASDPDQQQRLLGRSMRALDDIPVLSSRILNQYTPKHETFRSEEAVQLVFETLPLDDFIGVWDKLGPRYQTSATYVARIAIDSDVT